MTTNTNSPSNEPMSINFSEASHLFLDDLASIRNILTSDAEVTALLHVINRINNEIESLKETKKQHAEFYDNRIKNAEGQADFLKTRISEYLKTVGKTKLPTPNGTVFFTTRQKATWPDDDTLLQFCKDNNIEYKVSESPLKTNITEFMKQSGQIPPGYSEAPDESLSIRNA